MSGKFKYYVENDGDCGYEIRRAIPSSKFLRTYGTLSKSFDSFGEAKKYALKCIQLDIDDLRTHKYYVGKIKKNQVEEL